MSADRYIIALDCWRSTRTLYAINGNGIVTSDIAKAAKYRSHAEALYKSKQYAQHNPRVVTA